jgi:hypothetical protein
VPALLELVRCGRDPSAHETPASSIIALIVGIAGLAAGFGALLMARGRTRV